MKLRRLISVISSLVLLAACQTAPPQGELQGEHLSASADALESVAQTLPGAEIPNLETELAAELTVQPVPPPKDLWNRIGRELTWQTLEVATSTSNQNSTHKKTIDKARNAILRQPQYLPIVADRANYYLYYIVEEIEKRGLPLELALLPLVESTLNPFAYSSSRAAGLWQIMPATGRYLSLQQNWWYDGRRDLRDSTDAALNYLESLHADFEGDWMLTLAAYNAGKGRVGKARRANARKGLPTDYWSLRLPRETRNYVPKMIALAQIISEPERYNAILPEVKNTPAFEVVATGGQLELYRAAKLAGIDIGTLRAFNPGHRRWATAPDQPSELLLPLGKRETFEYSLANLSDEDRVEWQHYRIERGDSLIRIARRFDTGVKLLREVNGIRGSRIRAGDTLLIPQGQDWAQSLALAGQVEKKPQGYRVRRGDSLHRIADKFNVSINDLIAWNSLDPRKYLQPGQKLKLYVAGG